MSVFHLCVGPILCPTTCKHCRWVVMKVLCKLIDCMHPGQEVKCEVTQTAAVANKTRKSTLALPNCSLASYFAAGKRKPTVTYNLLEIPLYLHFNLFLPQVERLLYCCILQCSAPENMITIVFNRVPATMSLLGKCKERSHKYCTSKVQHYSMNKLLYRVIW